jgi:arylsulfatase A-like enzyme
MLGDHALMLKGPMLFEPVVRVPLIIHQPGAVPAGLCIASLVQSIDLTATILSAADVPGAFQTQGSDLMSLVMNPEMPWREWALSEYRDSGHAFSPPVHTTMLRHRNFKLVVWHGEPASSMPREGELYDLEQDPGEHRNLFCDPRYAAVRESLKDLLLDVSVAVEWPRPLRTAQW